MPVWPPPREPGAPPRGALPVRTGPSPTPPKGPPPNDEPRAVLLGGCMVLVTLLLFAWWLVSVSSPASNGVHGG